MFGQQTQTGIRIAIAVAAACFAVAVLWNVLIEARIVVPPLADSANDAFFGWWRPHEWQTAAVHLLAAAGFIALAAAGGSLPVTLLTVGGVLGAAAQLLQLGGQHAVLTASLTSLDPGSLGTIGFTIDSATQAISSGAYVTIGAGVVSLAGAFSAGRRPVTVTSAATGVAFVLLGVLLILDVQDLANPLTALLGIVLFPAWAWAIVTQPLISGTAAAVSPSPISSSASASPFGR